jgi:site-specific recombinase XerD
MSTLTLGDAALMIREAVRDKGYRGTPLGLEVGRYVRWKRVEWGATNDTMRDYESILAKTALYFADLELVDFAPPVGTDRLRECWEHYWGERAARTRGKVRSVWIDFFEWAVRERGLYGNPARPLTSPKKRDVVIETFKPTIVQQILLAQDYLADWLACALILHYGLRRGGLANVARHHFDPERRLLLVHTKGGRIYSLPITEELFWLKLGQFTALVPDWQYLVYRQDTRKLRVPVEEAEETLELVGGTVYGYARATRRFHDRKPSGKMVHNWWYRCLARAGVVDEGVTSGANMHRGRHTAATELQRSKHDLKLTQMLLGHVDIRSTSRYAQLDTADLAEALSDLYDEGAE